MPELPEVETTLRGIKPHIWKQTIKNVIVRRANLRWPIPAELNNALKNKEIQSLKRRGKYILIKVKTGTLLIHLGMSGSLRILSMTHAFEKHDHVDIHFTNQKILRFTDPRRFGAVLWTQEQPAQHPLLKSLGPEPLGKSFSAHYLWEKAQGKKIAVKSFIMDSHIVVGVGNIYAAEALFSAGIHPLTAAGKITRKHYAKLVIAIKQILSAAIKKGGTTLKDFVDSDGKPGYFITHLKVYGREGLPCFKCKTALKAFRLGQRITVYCEKCQKVQR